MDFEIKPGLVLNETYRLIEIIGRGEFPRTGLFTTTTKVHFECLYENGTRLICQTDEKTGIAFQGDRGRIYVNRGIIETEPKSLSESIIRPKEIHLYRSYDHKQNFIECLRSRREPVASDETGHRTATVCHLGNIAMLTGRRLKWDPKKERFIDDSQANRMLDRRKRGNWGS